MEAIIPYAAIWIVFNNHADAKKYFEDAIIQKKAFCAMRGVVAFVCEHALKIMHRGEFPIYSTIIGPFKNRHDNYFNVNVEYVENCPLMIAEKREGDCVVLDPSLYGITTYEVWVFRAKEE